MTVERILEALVGSGPVAIVLLYWVWSERHERVELQNKLIEVLEASAQVGEATGAELVNIRRALKQALARRD